MQYYTTPEPAPERRWIAARDARRLIRDRTGNLYPEQLVKGLGEAGLLQARAKLMTVERAGLRSGSRPEKFQDVLVPKWFWGECCQRDRHHWDWAAGSFSGRGYMGTSIAVEMLLVDFDADQLDAHFPDPKLVSAEDEDSSGGKPALSDHKLNVFMEGLAPLIRDRTLNEEQIKAALAAAFPANHVTQARRRVAIEAVAPYRTKGRPPGKVAEN